MDELIARLKEATEGSHALSWEIAEALGWAKFWAGQTIYVLPGEHAEKVRAGLDQDWMDWPYEVFSSVPEYTTSLDAALTLVPEGAVWHVMTDYGHLRRAKVGPPNNPSASVYKDADRPLFVQADAATPALALCIAALRARQTLLRGAK